MKKAFTLIEVIVAAGVFAFFLGSVMAAMIANAHNGPVNERRLQAANLAREGTQLVTQVRDTMWITGQTINWWNSTRSGSCRNLVGGQAGAPSGDCRLTYANNAWNLVPGEEPISDTDFTREITITDSGKDKKLITVTVWWLEGGARKDIIMKKLLTDWKAI